MDEIRKQIDELDLKMAKLFEERMNLIKKALEVKKEKKLPLVDNVREQSMIEKNVLYINEEFARYYIEFLKSILKISKEYYSENSVIR